MKKLFTPVIVLLTLFQGLAQAQKGSMEWKTYLGAETKLSFMLGSVYDVTGGVFVSTGLKFNKYIYAGAGTRPYYTRRAYIVNTSGYWEDSWRTNKAIMIPFFADVRGFLPIPGSIITPFLEVLGGYAFGISLDNSDYRGKIQSCPFGEAFLGFEVKHFTLGLGVNYDTQSEIGFAAKIEYAF